MPDKKYLVIYARPGYDFVDVGESVSFEEWTANTKDKHCLQNIINRPEDYLFYRSLSGKYSAKTPKSDFIVHECSREECLNCLNGEKEELEDKVNSYTSAISQLEQMEVR